MSYWQARARGRLLWAPARDTQRATAKRRKERCGGGSQAKRVHAHAHAHVPRTGSHVVPGGLDRHPTEQNGSKLLRACLHCMLKGLTIISIRLKRLVGYPEYKSISILLYYT
jgi:hypothetical protein